MTSLGMKCALSIVAGMAMSFLFVAEAAAQAKAKTSTARNPDGSTRIKVEVTQGGVAIKDVHLCVAKTTHGAGGEKTDNGDPLNKNYSSPAGAAAPAAGTLGPAPTPNLPNGWGYRGVVENGVPNKPNESIWCVTWTADPAAGALGGDTTFYVDYSGGKGDVGLSRKENLFLTTAGGVTYDPADIKNGAGKGEKGHMPTAVFAQSSPPLVCPQGQRC